MRKTIFFLLSYISPQPSFSLPTSDLRLRIIPNPSPKIKESSLTLISQNRCLSLFQRNEMISRLAHLFGHEQGYPFTKANA